jgi:hypothetical protein
MDGWMENAVRRKERRLSSTYRVYIFRVVGERKRSRSAQK